MVAGGRAPITGQDIIEKVRVQGGEITQDDYSKFMGKLQEFGFTGLKSEIPHDGIKVKLLVEKLAAFQQNGGTAERMIRALKAARIKERDLGL